jgi:hypothetical protein
MDVILFYWPLINLMLLLIVLGISIYFIPLAVKAIKIILRKTLNFIWTFCFYDSLFFLLDFWISHTIYKDR